MSLTTSATIGRYEIVRELGHGAMGVVYEARDPVLDRTVALKVIKPAAEGDELEAYEERFLAEARIAAQLQHPGIVVVHDVGRDEASGTLFIALELLRGQTLAELARQGQLEWTRVMRIVGQVARALGFAHARGVVHRDVKPANVIVLPSGEAKVTDFGIAQLENARQRLTSTGEFIGTPLYTAPEQARVEDVDGRADVFSLASVAYTLLAGRPPFMAPNIPGIVHRVVYEEPEPLSRFVPELPLDVERVMARAMAKDPAARYPTAEAFAEDAEDVVAGQPPRNVRGDDLVVVEESGTIRFRAGAAPAPASSLPVLPAAADANDTRTSLPAPRRDASRRDPKPSRAGLLAAAVIVSVLIAIFVWIPKSQPRRDPDAAASAQPVPGTRGARSRRAVGGGRDRGSTRGARKARHRLRAPAAPRQAEGLRGRRAHPRSAAERPGDEEGGRLHDARGHVPRRARRRAGAARGADRGGVGRRHARRADRRQLPVRRRAQAGSEPRPLPARPQARVEVTSRNARSRNARARAPIPGL